MIHPILFFILLQTYFIHSTRIKTSKMEGWYSWSYAGGTFPVALRSFGVFYCPKYPDQAKWIQDGDKILIEWGSYGKYELRKTDDEAVPTFVGGPVNKPDSWRRMVYDHSFSAEEQLLSSGGSEWNFEYEKGSFPIEFRGDGLNHFVCPQFPAHAHWTLEDTNKVTINWGTYGTYEMVLDAATATMTGNKKGQPTNWRRATFIRNLGIEGLTSLPSHEHSHKHDENCNH